jgi:hypothetical protein
MSDPVPAKIKSVWPPLLLLLMSLGYAYWAQDYGDIPRLMPTLVGLATAGLAVLDLLSRFDTRLGRALQLTLGADFERREMSHDPSLASEARQLGWMVGCIVALLMIGILPTVPLFILAYMRFSGGQPWMRSALSALFVLIFVTVVFEVLLDYSLYRGVLFDPRGFGAW